MESKAPNNDSWKSFWLFECYLTLMMILAVAFKICKWPGKNHFTVGGALTVGLIAALGGVVLGLIHRAISKRNNALGFFFIMTSCGTIPLSDRPMPLGEAIYRLAGLLLFQALFITLIEIFQRAWTSRRAKPLASPLADAEIDARPLA